MGVDSRKEANMFSYRTFVKGKASCTLYYTGTLFTVVNVHQVTGEAMDVNSFAPTGINNSANVVLAAEKDGAAASFDLTFNCRSLLSFMKSGTNVQFGVPYPEGFDARDEAYYFVKNAEGGYTAKELKTQFTDLGLEVLGTL